MKRIALILLIVALTLPAYAAGKIVYFVLAEDILQTDKGAVAKKLKSIVDDVDEVQWDDLSPTYHTASGTRARFIGIDNKRGWNVTKVAATNWLAENLENRDDVRIYVGENTDVLRAHGFADTNKWWSEE